MPVCGEIVSRDEFSFRIHGTSDLLTFKDLDKAMRDQMLFERDKIDDKLQWLVKQGYLATEDVDTKMQERMQHERDHIENRLIEIFDLRLRGDDKSIGFMKAGTIMSKFR